MREEKEKRDEAREVNVFWEEGWIRERGTLYFLGVYCILILKSKCGFFYFFWNLRSEFIFLFNFLFKS